ncbi:MAG: tetratricopeptide repeat protein, partial [Ignavibacteria bacterium]|nr:tetratricopeptide repeat protein [Ignavibacteria bacterium]
MKHIFIFLVVSTLCCAGAFSQTKTFVREYTYNAGDNDSKNTSRAIALEQVKRLLLEEIGVYLESSFETEKKESGNKLEELTRSKITTIAAGVTETKILDEKWNGVTYYIKAEITLDENEVKEKIAAIAKDREKLTQLEDVRKRADSAFTEIDRLRKELEETKDENERLKLTKTYTENTNVLSATDWFQKGYDAYEQKNYEKAVTYYSAAIELNPQYASAYLGRGVAYENLQQYTRAIEDYTTAIELNPQYAS